MELHQNLIFIIPISLGIIALIVWVSWPHKYLCIHCRKQHTTYQHANGLSICESCQMDKIIGKEEQINKLLCPKCRKPMKKHIIEETVVDVCHPCNLTVIDSKRLQELTLELEIYPALLPEFGMQ